MANAQSQEIDKQPAHALRRTAKETPFQSTHNYAHDHKNRGNP
jgi:hypothetical protein